MAYTEFYCDATNGNNLWAGSSTSTTPYTKTAGNWVQSTRVYTVQDGSNPSTSVNVGDFASVYPDGSAAPAVYIGRVTAVQNAVNGTITLDATANAGSAPVNGTANRTIVVGGVWKGPNGASGFPFSLSLSIQTLMDASNDPTRVNMKNNATYSMTAGITAVAGFWVAQGYTSTVGDGGRAIIDAGSTNAVIFMAASNNIFADIIFANNATGTSNGLTLTTGCQAFRCVVHGVRGSGISTNALCMISECEIYDFNKSNTANLAGIDFQASGALSANYIHDGTGSNCNGIRTSAGNSSLSIVGNIIDTCAGAGISVSSNNNLSALVHIITGNDFYSCNYGIKVEAINGNYWLIIKNNNFIKNTTAAFEGGTTFNRLCGYFFNNGYGSGTQANGSDYLHTGSLIRDDATGNSSRVVYAANITPYKAPITGDFRIILAAAISAGRGAFTQTDGTNTGAVGFPDIGAAQAQTTTASWNGGDFVDAPGYLGRAYTHQWIFSDPNAVLSVSAGSLPTGLSLSAIPGSAALSGTPTAIGTFSFTLSLGVSGGSGDATWHITINADPEEGAGGIGGS